MIRWSTLVVVLIVLFIVPLLVVVIHALSARWLYPELIPSVWSVRGLEFLVRNGPGIARSVLSSFLYSTASVILAFLVCVTPARALAYVEFRGKIFVEALLLSPVLVPAITYGMGIHFLFIRLGLANNRIGVVLVLTAAAYPYMLRALIAGYQQVDPNFELCAANLGAGRFRRLTTVTIPMLVPAIVAGGTVVFLVAFSDYFLVFLIGGGAIGSFTGYLFPYLTSGDRTLGSVLTLVFLVIPVTLFIAVEFAVRRVYRNGRRQDV